MRRAQEKRERVTCPECGRHDVSVRSDRPIDGKYPLQNHRNPGTSTWCFAQIPAEEDDGV